VRGRQCNAFHPISCFPLQKSGERLKCAPALAGLRARFLRASCCTLGRGFAVPLRLYSGPRCLPQPAAKQPARARRACKQRKPSSKGQGEGPAAWRKRARTPSPAGEREAPAGRSPGPRPRRTKQSATAQPGPSCESPAPHAAAAEQAAVDQGAAHAGAPLSPCASWGLGEADGFFCLAADPHAAGPDAWPAGEPHGYGEHDRGAEELLADDPFRAAPRERATGAAAPSAGDAHATGEPSVGSAGAWTSPTRASSLRELDDVLARLLEAAPSTTQAACGEGPGSWDARPACDAPFAGMHDGAGHAPAARPAATRAAAAENAYGAADSEYLTRIETTLQRCSAFDDGIPRSSPMPVEGILLFNY
jgi:hypothetical protein